MERLKSINKLNSVYVHSKYLATATLFLLTLVTALIIPASTASAAESISEYPITSTYTHPTAITATTGSGGSMWYIERDSSGNPNTIGNVTTSGTTTDYSVIPSGDTWANITSITTGPDGNIWFNGCAGTSSSSNMVVGSLNTSTGAITAETHDTGLWCGEDYGPGPITTGPDGDIWAVINSNNPSTSSGWIDEFTSSGTYKYYWQPGYSTSYAQWSSITAGPDGNLWLTDSHNNQIDKLTLSTTTDEITAADSYTVPTSNSDPDAITTGPDGNLWFIEDTKDQIGTITPSGTITEYTIPSGSEPNALTAGPDGALWFTEFSGNRIGRISTSGSVTEYSVTTSGSDPYGITAGPDNALWFTEFNSGKIGRISAAPFFSEYPITSTYTHPTAITATTGSGGSMWYIERDSSGNPNTIGNVTTSGTTTDYSVIPSGDTWANITSITTGPDGNIWFNGCAGTSSSSNMVVGSLNTSTGAITAETHDTGLWCGEDYGPGPITTGPDGDIWAVINSNNPSTSSGWIDEFTSSGTYKYYWQPGYSTSYAQWSSITAGPDGNLWLTDSHNNQIDKLTLSTTTDEITAADSYTVPTSNSDPDAITTGPDGNLWFIEDTKDQIGTITPSGTITEYTIPSGSEPNALTAGPDGALWFTEFSGNRIGRISTSGSVTEYSVTTSGSDPYGITAGPDNALWFTEFNSGKIGRLGY